MHIRDENPIEEHALNLTSMTDLVFLLLIFFLCATTFMRRERALDLELPQASNAQPVTDVDEVVINVLRDGSISIHGAIVEPDNLRGELARAAQRNRETPVTIRGDRLAHHETIVQVMDACGAAGLTNLAVGTLEGS